MIMIQDYMDFEYWIELWYIGFLACIAIYMLYYVYVSFGMKHIIPLAPVGNSPPCSHPKETIHPYAVHEIQGNRAYMEDRYNIVGSVKGDFLSSFYGVFDGHGGARAAQFCAENMCRILTQNPVYDSDPSLALKSTFLAIDNEFLDYANTRGLDDGTTAVVCLIKNQILFVANAGDSRAIIVGRDMSFTPMSEDHKPNRPDEMLRIKKAGGCVLFRGTWRVEGILAVSRAIGDRPLKDYVTSMPEVTQKHLDSNDAFCVLASDGLWDVMTSEQVAHMLLTDHERGLDIDTCAKRLVQEAFYSGSGDNISIVIIDLRKKNTSKVNTANYTKHYKDYKGKTD